MDHSLGCHHLLSPSVLFENPAEAQKTRFELLHNLGVTLNSVTREALETHAQAQTRARLEAAAKAEAQALLAQQARIPGPLPQKAGARPLTPERPKPIPNRTLVEALEELRKSGRARHLLKKGLNSSHTILKRDPSS